MKTKILLIWIWLIIPNMILANDRFIKNYNIVIDTKTNLIWQSQPITEKLTHKKAKKYCQNLVLDGYNDWKLPNIYELKSLVNYEKYNPAIATSFIEIKIEAKYYYWSSSNCINEPSIAWGVNFNFGQDSKSRSSKTIGYILCVRE